MKCLVRWTIESLFEGLLQHRLIFEDEGEGDGEPTWTRSPDSYVPAFAGSRNGDTRSSASISPHTRATNLVGCRSQGISSIAKRPRLNMNLIDTLNPMSVSTSTIRKMHNQVALDMHKDNLLDRQENKRIELEIFKMQQIENEKLATIFIDVVMGQIT